MKGTAIRKNLLVAASVAVIAASVFSGCSKGGTEAQSPSPTTGASPASQGENGKGGLVDFSGLSFTEYVHYDWATDFEWGQKATTKWIQDNKKVNIKWINSGGAAQQKLNTLIASNDLPDAMVIDRGPQLEQLVKAGVLTPIDDYVKKYPNLRKWASDKVLNSMRASDGKLYGFPNWYTNEQHPLGNSGWMINKKVYQELGSPKLETYTDLENYLKQVKAKYPNMIPLNIGYNFSGGPVMYATFGENRTKDVEAMFVYQEGNQIKSIFQDPAFHDYLIYVNRLYRQGLIESDTFTEKKEQTTERLATGNVAVAVMLDIGNAAKTAHDSLRKLDPNNGYQAIFPIHKEGLDKNKLTPSAYAAQGWNITVITKKAKEPEKIFAYLDWLTGEEGSAITNYGPPGLYWDKTETINGTAVPVPNDKFKSTSPADINTTLGGYNWSANGAWASIASAYRDSLNPPKEGEWDSEKTIAMARKTAMNTDAFQNILPDPASDTGTIYQRVQDDFNQQIARAVLAASEDEVKSIIKKANENAVKLGYDKVLAELTQKWQENVKKIASK